jgi:hypothetical protein
MRLLPTACAALEQPRAHRLGVVDEVVLLHDLQIGQPGGAGHRMRRVRVGVDVLLLGVLGNASASLRRAMAAESGM